MQFMQFMQFSLFVAAHKKGPANAGPLSSREHGPSEPSWRPLPAAEPHAPFLHETVVFPQQ